MSRLAGDMKGFVVLGVYMSTVKKQNKEKNTAEADSYCQYIPRILWNERFITVFVTICHLSR